MKASILCLLFTLLTAIPCTAQNQVTIYDEAGYTGFSQVIPNKWEANGVSTNFNNAISSIRVPAGAIVMIFEEEGFKGAKKLLTADWEASGEDAVWNNQISSIRVLDVNFPYTLVFQAFVKRNGNWKATDDITLLSSGRLFLGMDEITEPEEDASGQGLSFIPHGTLYRSGKLKFTDYKISGWLQDPGEEKLALYANLYNVHFYEREPRLARETYPETPVAASLAKWESQFNDDGPPGSIGQPLIHSGQVTCYKEDRFNGERMILYKSWAGTDNSLWYDAIRSVRVSPGWMIRVYADPEFKGAFRDLTADWSVSDDPRWLGAIGSIKVIRKGAGR